MGEYHHYIYDTVSISFKINRLKKEKKSYVIQNYLSQSWLTTAQIVVHLPVTRLHCMQTISGYNWCEVILHFK